MSEGNYSVQTEDNQSIKNLKNVFENKERKDNNARSPKNSNNLSTKKDGNWVKKNRFSLGLSIEVDNDEGQNQPVEIVSTNVINNTEYAENNEVDIKEKIKKFQGNSRKKEEITFEELKSRKYVKTTLEFGVGGTPRESGLANNEAGVETVVPERNRRITERFEENYDDDDPSENQDDTDYEGKVKEKVEYYENIKGSGEPEYIPQFGKHEWDNQRTYGESGNEVNQPENRRTDYSSDITYETTYGKYKSPTHKEYGKTKITTPQANQLNNNRTDFSSDISYETTYGKYNESKYKESEKTRITTPQASQLNNKRTDYAQDVSYETTYGKHKEHGHKESEKTKITTPQANQLNSKRTDFSSDVSYETTYGKYNESKHKESEKTRITTPQASQLNNKRTDYAQDVSYETTYGKHKEHGHKESKESERTLTQQLNQEYKSSTPLESSTMQKSSSTNSSSYQPPTIKIDKANIEMTEQHTGESPGSKQMSTSIEKTPIQVNKPRDDDSYFRLDTSTNDDQFFGKSSSIVIIDNKFETSFQKEAKRKEGCCSAFCKHILKIFK